MKNNSSFVIAIDAMGGDHAPRSVLEGIDLFMSKNKEYKIKFLLFGDKAEIKELMTPEMESHCEVIHTDKVINNDDKVYDALKGGKGTSMYEAINTVKDGGRADAVISGGNTGALMALSKMLLKMLPNIDRPAIITNIPSKLKPCVFLDLGANVEVTPEVLLQFAIMGQAFASVVLDLVNPKAGLLNIGSEDVKGSDNIKEASKLLANSSVINYSGFVEPDSIFEGKVDIIVTDGYSGNIALKATEGTMKFYTWLLKGVFRKSLLSKIGMLFLLPSLRKLKKMTDPRKFNGAMLIGLNGISVKSHGGADKVAFASAVLATAKLVQGRVNLQIEDKLKNNK